MRFYLVIIILLFISCEENSANHEAESEVGTVEMHCFYPMDDKYHESTDKVELDNWVNQKNQSILVGELKFDLFDRNGGGPNGAEWNASTDLCLVIRSNQDYTISLNGEVYNEERINLGTMDWIVVKRSFWESHLRKMEHEDKKIMFPEGIPLEETFPIIPIEEMGFGEVIKFELTTADTTLIKYFHVAFGE